MNRLLDEDFQYVMNTPMPWDDLNDKTVLITGGTGFLGQLLARFFSYLNENQQRNISIVLLVHDKQKAEQCLENFADAEIHAGDLCDAAVLSSVQRPIDYIFHCAATTISKTMVEKPVEVAEGIIFGTSNILKLAHRNKIKSMVYLSSMEVYGTLDSFDDHAGEDKMGTVEILSSRSSYPMGKRMAENICFDYCSEYGVPVKIARLAQTFGPGVLPSDRRVFTQFADSVINGTDIILHTKGDSDTNCCYTADALWALFMLLFCGENGAAYNIANESNHMTIKEMADLVADKVARGTISVKVELDVKNINGYPPAAKLNLSSQKLRKLGWEPMVGMEQMYLRMIEYMRG